RSTYEISNLNFETSVPLDLKYSPASHGMRVQMLLERDEELESGAVIFLGHLACHFGGSRSGVGIYLISPQAGLYQRIRSDTLVFVDSTIRSKLGLEDVYMTNTQLEPCSRSSSGWNQYNGLFSIDLDEKLEQSGFTVSDYT